MPTLDTKLEDGPFWSFDLASIDVLKNFKLCTDIYKKVDTNFLRQYERVKSEGEILSSSDVDCFITAKNKSGWIKSEDKAAFSYSLLLAVNDFLIKERTSYREKLILEEAAYSLCRNHSLRAREALITSLSEEGLSDEATTSYLKFISRLPAITPYTQVKFSVLLTLDLLRVNSLQREIHTDDLIMDLLFEGYALNESRSKKEDTSPVMKIILASEELAFLALPLGGPLHKGRLLYAIELVHAKFYAEDNLCTDYFLRLGNIMTELYRCI